MKKMDYLMGLALSSIVFNAPIHSEIAYAGGESSGGGTAVVCFKNDKIPELAQQVRANDGIIKSEWIPEIASLETFDLYEAQRPRGFSRELPIILKPINDQATFQDYVESIRRRLKFALPELAAMIEQAKEDFPDENILNHQNGIKMKYDLSFEGIINTRECTLVTIASQEERSGQYYLNLDERLFYHEKMSVLSQGVLLLHEYFYHSARLRGHTTSDNTRKFVGFIITHTKPVSARSLLGFARKTGFIDPPSQEEECPLLECEDNFKSQPYSVLNASVGLLAEHILYHLNSSEIRNTPELNQQREILEKKFMDLVKPVTPANSICAGEAGCIHAIDAFLHDQRGPEHAELRSKLEALRGAFSTLVEQLKTRFKNSLMKPGSAEKSWINQALAALENQPYLVAEEKEHFKSTYLSIIDDLVNLNFQYGTIRTLKEKQTDFDSTVSDWSDPRVKSLWDLFYYEKLSGGGFTGMHSLDTARVKHYILSKIGYRATYEPSLFLNRMLMP